MAKRTDHIQQIIDREIAQIIAALAYTPDTKLHLSSFTVNRHHAYRPAQKILFCLELNKLSRLRRPRQQWSC